MNFDKDSLIKFFNDKLAEAGNIDAANDEESLNRWWANTRRCCEKMGDDYLKLLGNVSFHSGVYLMGEVDFNKSADRSARVSGLKQAKNAIRRIIDDLDTFGYAPNTSQGSTNERSDMIVNINNAQNMSIDIKISDFDIETQNNIRELQAELSKKKKNKEAIKKILAKLGETGLDALEKIFLHSIGIN